ncbi:MAG: hypothetical protein R3C28_18725 [Pirellulaceae bacterium]
MGRFAIMAGRRETVSDLPDDYEPESSAIAESNLGAELAASFDGALDWSDLADISMASISLTNSTSRNPVRLAVSCSMFAVVVTLSPQLSQCANTRWQAVDTSEAISSA